MIRVWIASLFCVETMIVTKPLGPLNRWLTGLRGGAMALGFMALAACSGGDANDPAASGASRAGTSAITMGPLATRQAVRQAPTSTWVHLLDEFQDQRFPSGEVRNVRFGVGPDRWIYATAPGWINCSLWFFGWPADPAPGERKTCQVEQVTDSSNDDWVPFINEFDHHTFADPVTRTIRFGVAPDRWIYGNTTSWINCSMWFFSGHPDPAPGERKTCQLLRSSLPAGFDGGVNTPIAPPSAPQPVEPPPVVVTPTPTPTPAPQPLPTQERLAVFFSGHSLMDDPLPGDTERIASSLGKQQLWNQQNAVGSPIRWRTRGSGYDDPSYPGYRFGKNRDRFDMDVVEELRNPQTIDGQRYGALVITERHDSVSVIQWEDTVRYLRHYHDRLIDGNANASTWLYHPWLGVRERWNPWPWLAYERSAAPVWQCVASRVNLGLANEGRQDRVRSMPASAALATLVERAVTGYLDGVTGATMGETMNQIFLDDVHLTRLGTYYLALLNHSMLFGTSPVGAWAPTELTPTQANTLQQLAWQVASNHRAAAGELSMDACQSWMRDNFCESYSNYVGRPWDTASCQAFYTQPSSANPFHFNAATDRSYWFAAPTR